jgi:hypothetical protein
MRGFCQGVRTTDLHLLSWMVCDGDPRDWSMGGAVGSPANDSPIIRPGNRIPYDDNMGMLWSPGYPAFDQPSTCTSPVSNVQRFGKDMKRQPPYRLCIPTAPPEKYQHSPTFCGLIRASVISMHTQQFPILSRQIRSQIHRAAYQDSWSKEIPTFTNILFKTRFSGELSTACLVNSLLIAMRQFRRDENPCRASLLAE